MGIKKPKQSKKKKPSISEGDATIHPSNPLFPAVIDPRP